MIKAALFDMDGTLVDNTPVHIRAFELFCARYGITDWQQKLAGVFGMGNDDILGLIMPEEVAKQGVQALADEKEAIYRELYAPEIQPLKGLVKLLKQLHSKGIRCAVGSSGCRKNVEFVVDKCGLGDYFETQINGDMVAHCKPNPEIYLKAAAALGVAPSECLIFEDAPAGFEAARRAGAGCIVGLSTTLTVEQLAEQQQLTLIIPDYRPLTEGDTLEKLLN